MQSVSHVPAGSRWVQAVRRLRASRTGNVSVAFALSLLPIVGMMGASIDYTYALQVRRKMQDAADAGILAAAVKLANAATDDDLTKNQAKALVQSAITDNIKAMDPNFPTPTITPTIADGKITAIVSSGVDTSFLRVLNITSIDVGVKSVAKYTAEGTTKVEVALVLDATASMAQDGKLDAAKLAAKQLVDTLIPPDNGGGTNNNPNARIRLSVVPFSSYVNVGLQYAGASWLTDTSTEVVNYAGYWDTTYINVVWGPPYLHTGTCYNDGVPYDCSSVYSDAISYDTTQVWVPPGSYQNVWSGCVGSRPYPDDMSEALSAAKRAPAMRGYACNNALARLDSRNASINQQIAALNAYGETYLAPGLLWGWRTVSPTAPFADGNAYAPGTQKFVVMMTDGFNTRSVNYPAHEYSDSAQSDQLTLETCTAIKATGVKLYTVSFQVYNNLAEPLLKACATDDSYYYNAITNAALQGAFQSIANKISAGSAVKVHLVQ